jgi:integrase
MSGPAGLISATALAKRISAAQEVVKTLKAQISAGTLVDAKTGKKRTSVPRRRVAVGVGLYVLVDDKGPRSWALLAQKDNKRRMFGLGVYGTLTLAQAREKAAQWKADIAAGLDPRERDKPAPTVPTFAEAARIVFAEKLPTFTNKRHQQTWITSLEAYAFPAIGTMPVDKVSEADVRDLILPIWLSKNETASRVRQRIKDVVLWAAAKKYRELPLHMDMVNHSLPRKPKRGHFAAMPYDDVPGFMARLIEMKTVSATALRFTILTAMRSGEVRHATWAEMDIDSGIWMVPPERMKMNHNHRVPLSAGALNVLEAASRFKHTSSDLVFPGMKPTKPMSDMTLTKALRDMGLGGKATAHGFRSSFKDWAAETTDFADRISEAALAHADVNATRAAYQRGDLFEKRRALMDAWCSFVLPPDHGGNVVPIKQEIAGG